MVTGLVLPYKPGAALIDTIGVTGGFAKLYKVWIVAMVSVLYFAIAGRNFVIMWDTWIILSMNKVRVELGYIQSQLQTPEGRRWIQQQNLQVPPTIVMVPATIVMPGLLEISVTPSLKPSSGTVA